MDEARHLYMIALGSNRRHRRYGRPAHVVRAAIAALDSVGMVEAQSAIIPSAPVGPSIRRFANAAVMLSSSLDPTPLLHALWRIENAFGRKRWRRWGERVLDLDIILWSGGCWASRDLIIPHPAFRKRAFVLDPAAQISPDWRDPVTGKSVRQLRFRNRGSVIDPSTTPL